MDYTPLAIMGIAIGIGIGHYSIFYLYMEKDFVKRYKAFKDAFDKWMEDEVTKFYKSIESMIMKKTEFKELSDFISKWATRASNLTSIFETYRDISKRIRWILLSLVGSVVASGLHLMNPNMINAGAEKPIFWIDIATALLFLSVLLILYYLYSFHEISSKVTEFELGEPIEKIFEKVSKSSTPF
jgi:hypothetical protein